MKLVSVKQMRAIEKEADARGLTYAQMMANAGRSVAEIVLRAHLAPRGSRVVGLVGPGNNGGDTLVALSHMAAAGWRASGYLVRRPKDELARSFVSAGGDIEERTGDAELGRLGAQLDGADIVLDGILGTGIRLPLEGDVRQVLAHAGEVMAGQEVRPVVVAVDCPSGVDCDTGEAAQETLRADLTVTMGAVKEGLLKLPAHEFVGDLEVAEIGLPADLESTRDLDAEVAGRQLVAALMPERRADAHKGTFGTALIAAGSVNYTGAAVLAGRAAYRVGAGLVTLAVPAPLHAALAGRLEEATWILLPHEMGVISREAAEVLAENLGRATALLIGCGLGAEPTTREFLQQFLSAASAPIRVGAPMGFVRDQQATQRANGVSVPPLVVDADGLRILSQLTNWHTLIPSGTILTPHPGEMAAMTGLHVEEIQANRRETASRFSREWNQIVVLKGAFTVIAVPDGRSTVIPVASSALAKAGTGDVLAGTIVGLRAQGLGAYEAAVAGAWLHGRAGLLAAQRVGSPASVLAGDVCESLSNALAELR